MLQRPLQAVALADAGSSVFSSLLWRVFDKKGVSLPSNRNLYNMAAHNDLGHKGEDMAAEYLQQNGYCILDRNWTNRGRKELDIVATKDDVVVFVEVKTRKVGSVTTPISAVNNAKQHRIVLAADSYLKAHHIDFRCRFDIIGIIYDDESSRIEHYENAFMPRPKFYR